MKAHRILVLLAIFMAVTARLSGGFVTAAVAAQDEKAVLYWVAPMDPNYRRDGPGKSPMGMDLIPVYADGNAPANTVTISPEIVQNLGVRTKQAVRTQLLLGIDTVGYVDYNESKVSHIHLRTEGWIEKLSVRSEGERVKKGDRLFDLYSPALVNVQQEFVTALSSGNKGLIRASKERLSALGISSGQIDELQKTRDVRQRISIYAQQDGVVTTLPVREGMFVKPEMNIMSLGDLSSVWLLAEVFERQAAWVAVGQPAEVRLSYVPGMAWDGKVEYIYPDLNPKTRTLKVRMRFDNPGESLKPNMYASVKIYSGAKNNVVVIPLEGLIRTGRSERVIIALGNGRFEARDVVSGIESGYKVEIRQGVKAGEDIVVSGQFLIDSEASLRASLMRMSVPDSDDGRSGKSKSVTVSGTVKAVKAGERKLNILHEAIEDLGWPSMSMDFHVADGVDLDGLQVGDAVTFTLQQQDERYRITSIQRMQTDDAEKSP